MGRELFYIRSFLLHTGWGCIKERSLDNSNGLTNRSSLLIPSAVILLLTSVNGDVVVTIIFWSGMASLMVLADSIVEEILFCRCVSIMTTSKPSSEGENICSRHFPISSTITALTPLEVRYARYTFWISFSGSTIRTRKLLPLALILHFCNSSVRLWVLPIWLFAYRFDSSFKMQAE